MQEKLKCYQKLLWQFTVWIYCSADLNFFSRLLEYFFLDSRSEQFWCQNTIIKYLFYLSLVSSYQKQPSFLIWFPCIEIYFFLNFFEFSNLHEGCSQQVSFVPCSKFFLAVMVYCCQYFWYQVADWLDKPYL